MSASKFQMVGNIRLETSGQNRDCWLVGNWAIKTPTLRHGWRYFISGLMANMHEQYNWKTSMHPRLARLIWSAPGGWLNVYRRYEVLDRPLTGDELKLLPVFNPDPKRGNYGLDAKGKIIVLDYGHCDCYIKYTKEEWKEVIE